MDNPYSYPSLEIAPYRRLIFSLLAAASVHILVIGFLPLPHVTPFTPRPTTVLKVRLAPAIQPRENTEALSLNKILRSKTSHATPVRKMHPISSKSQATTRAEVSENMTLAPVNRERPVADVPSVPSIPTPSPASIESLLDSARSIVRDEARRRVQSKREEIDLIDRPVLPELAKALKKPKAGETRFANGLIKIVTPSGKALCYLPLPDIVARGGPIEPTIVPTNCP